MDMLSAKITATNGICKTFSLNFRSLFQIVCI